MRFQTLSMAIAAMIMLSVTGAALSAEPIEGKWLRPSTDTLVTYARQGDEYCGTVENGEYKGQSIGCMTGSGNTYKGKVVALDEGKTYSGKATIDGDNMKLEGCVLVLCKGETWQRQ